MMCMLVPCVAQAGDDEYIKVDWYPLFTDSVGWNIYTGDLVLGWNSASGADVAMGRSVDIGWLSVVGAKYNTGHGQRITMGLGINWRNFRLDKGKQFVQDEDHMSIVDAPAQASGVTSRVKVFSLTLPMMLRQRIARRMDVFAGPVLNFNLHASMETTYTLAGDKVKHKSNHIHQVPVTVDVMGGIKWRCLGCYVRYSPCHVLREQYAPAFNPLTVGLYIGF